MKMGAPRKQFVAKAHPAQQQSFEADDILDKEKGSL